MVLVGMSGLLDDVQGGGNVGGGATLGAEAGSLAGPEGTVIGAAAGAVAGAAVDVVNALKSVGGHCDASGVPCDGLPDDVCNDMRNCICSGPILDPAWVQGCVQGAFSDPRVVAAPPNPPPAPAPNPIFAILPALQGQKIQPRTVAQTSGSTLLKVTGAAIPAAAKQTSGSTLLALAQSFAPASPLSTALKARSLAGASSTTKTAAVVGGAGALAIAAWWFFGRGR